MIAKYSPMRTFYPPHVTDFFTGQEHPITAYKLFQYKKKLVDPLWIRTACTTHQGWKPVVRNTARRHVREAVRLALAERGWAFGGQQVGITPLPGPRTPPCREGRGVKGQSEGQPAGQPGGQPELRGSLTVIVLDAPAFLRLDRDRCLAIGREIVGTVENCNAGYKSPQGSRPQQSSEFGAGPFRH
jgi:hypothetical protein